MQWNSGLLILALRGRLVQLYLGVVGSGIGQKDPRQVDAFDRPDLLCVAVREEARPFVEAAVTSCWAEQWPECIRLVA